MRCIPVLTFLIAVRVDLELEQEQILIQLMHGQDVLLHFFVNTGKIAISQVGDHVEHSGPLVANDHSREEPVAQLDGHPIRHRLLRAAALGPKTNCDDALKQAEAR